VKGRDVKSPGGRLASVRLLITTIIFGVLILGAIVELLRRRRLREKYAALWLFTGFLVIVLAICPGGLDKAAGYRLAAG
jgi:Uncharacterized conserved protein (DUF2304)